MVYIMRRCVDDGIEPRERLDDIQVIQHTQHWSYGSTSFKLKKNTIETQLKKCGKVCSEKNG